MTAGITETWSWSGVGAGIHSLKPGAGACLESGQTQLCILVAKEVQ